MAVTVLEEDTCSVVSFDHDTPTEVDEDQRPLTKLSLGLLSATVDAMEEASFEQNVERIRVDSDLKSNFCKKLNQ